MRNFPLFVLVALLLSSPSFGQQLTTDKPVVKIVSQRSLDDLKAEDVYTSADETFTLRMSKTPDRVVVLTPELMRYPGSGSQLGWFVKEGFVSIMYYDYSDERDIPKTETKLGSFFTGFKDGILTSLKGEFLSEKTYVMADRRTYDFRFKMPNGFHGYARNFFVGSRNYAFLALANPDNTSAEALVLKTFDSFVAKDK